MTLDPGLSRMELDRFARTMRNIIIRGHPLPIFHGHPRGEGSARNDPVRFRDHVETRLAYVEVRENRLPPDLRANNRKWVTCTDQLTGHRRDMLTGSIAAHLGTCNMPSSPTPVTVYRMTEERDVVPASNVAVTEWPRSWLGRASPTPKRARSPERL